MLKKIGFRQDLAPAYWFNNDKQVYPADRIAKFKGWEKSYTAAIAGDALNIFLPVGATVTKTLKNLYEAAVKIEDKAFKASAINESQAKAELIKILVNKNIITL